MQNVKVEYNGCTTYWTIPDCSISQEDLETAWLNGGLPKEVLPKPPRASKALRRAVADMKSKRRMARPLSRGRAWALVDESAPNAEELDYAVVARAKLERDDAGQQTLVVESGNGLSDQVKSRYETELGVQRGVDIASMLIRLVYHLKGISLRDRGGIYFIPDTGVETWEKAAEAIQGLVKGSRVYRLGVLIDLPAARAVLDGLLSECNTAIQEVDEELQTALNAKAWRWRNRAEEVKSLEDKVSSYEGLLQTKLPDLSDALKNLRARVVEAQMVAETAEEEEQVQILR